LYGVTEEGKRTREAQKKDSEQSYNLDLYKFGVDKNFDELLAEERENFTALSEDAVLDYVISMYDSFIEYVNDITVDEKSTQHVLSQEMHDEFHVGEFNGVITNDEDMLFDCDDPERYAELEREIEEKKRSTARIHSLSEYVAAGGIDRDKTPMRDGPVIARGMEDPFLQAKCALKAWYQANDAKKFRTIVENMLDNPKNVIRIVPEGCVAVDFENLPAGFPPIEAWLFPQPDTPESDAGETAAPESEAVAEGEPVISVHNGFAPIATLPVDQWGLLTVEVLADGKDLKVSWAGKSAVRTYQEAGFMNQRNQKPVQAWGTLCLFADQKELPHTAENRSQVESKVASLRKKLSALFPDVQGDPLPHYREGKKQCYRPVFDLRRLTDS
jgi:hypothetical protein